MTRQAPLWLLAAALTVTPVAAIAAVGFAVHAAIEDARRTVCASHDPIVTPCQEQQ